MVADKRLRTQRGEEFMSTNRTKIQPLGVTPDEATRLAKDPRAFYASGFDHTDALEAHFENCEAQRRQ